MVAITSNKREHVLEAVNQMYTQVANKPDLEYHFPIGRKACEFVRYPDSTLNEIPGRALESFAGVACPFNADVIKAGDTVLDIGSGSGTDVMIAQRLVGPGGKIYALELTQAMRDKLQGILDENNIQNVEIVPGNAESIPLEDASVDLVTSNGVLNLVPDKVRAIGEIFRVLRPGGRLQLADIALHKPVSARFKQDPELWAECVVGAVSEERYLEMFRAAGFKDVELVESLDYFSGANSEKTKEVAGLFGAHSIVLRATKPSGAELSDVLAEQSSWRRRAGIAAKQVIGLVGAGVAAAVCIGTPVLVSAFGAVGLAAFATHAYMFPVFIAFAAATVWGLYRQGQRRANRAPFWLGLAAAVITSVMMWLMITGLYPFPIWLLYAGLGVLLAASIWCLLQPTLPDRCLDEMVRDVARRERPRSTRFARGAAVSVAAAAAFYGGYKSVEAFAPETAADAIACYGINACKGQAACVTAFNACPGRNACKGKGFLIVGKRECSARGGQPLKGSPADPARRNA